MEVLVPALSTHHCAACGDERAFEQPPCVEGHGDPCPELACVDCGAAILLDPPVSWPPVSWPPGWQLERPSAPPAPPAPSMLPARAA
jgi:hypothetical protein